MVQQLQLVQPEWYVHPRQAQLARNKLVPLEKEQRIYEEVRDEDTAKGLLRSRRDVSFDSFLHLSETFIRGD